MEVYRKTILGKGPKEKGLYITGTAVLPKSARSVMIELVRDDWPNLYGNVVCLQTLVTYDNEKTWEDYGYMTSEGGEVPPSGFQNTAYCFVLRPSTKNQQRIRCRLDCEAIDTEVICVAYDTEDFT